MKIRVKPQKVNVKNKKTKRMYDEHIQHDAQKHNKRTK